MQIKGLRAMVVGGASGMARATAERIAKAGGNVAVVDRAGSAGAEVAAAIGASWHECDILDFVGVEKVVADVVAALGGIDACIITAGGGIGAKTISKNGPHPLDDFRKTLDLNVVGTFNINRLVAWEMSKNEPNEDEERGVIINTSSIAAFEGQIGQAAYAASKAGVAAMALPMARELARYGIRVNTIAPGLFLTPMMEALPQDVQDSLGKATPFPPRLGRPAEFAAMARSIVENVMVNAELIRLDGAVRLAGK